MVTVFGGHGEAGDVEAAPKLFEVAAAVEDTCVVCAGGFDAFF